MSDSFRYNHSAGVHTLEGPTILLPIVLQNTEAESVLDVGCGIGVWLKAALESGVTDILGVDGVDIPPTELVIPEKYFRVENLTLPLSLGRSFDMALCLEVAEHIPESAAGTLIDSLITHSDTVVFSAACPGQEGQNHINAQWPTYWQQLFNERGFVCLDPFRELIWTNKNIEPWYRQNIFLARRAVKGEAGTERRLRSMVHPEILPGILNNSFSTREAAITGGAMPFKWYLKLPLKVAIGKFTRK
jgi:SAM-dependent methyltransferase